MTWQRIVTLAAACAAAGCLLAAAAACRPPRNDLKAATFERLSAIREEKKQQLVAYFENVRETAWAVADDAFMQACFHRLTAGRRADPAMELAIDRHYVQHYGNFYDILFVDPAGYVFHSIRKESDYGSHLFSGALSRTKLVENLRTRPRDSFVEYEYYPPSAEPAAFFAVPVMTAARLDGWFILQCSVNQVNALLTDREGLGRTGEVYLVNGDRLMLSDSRFIEDSTILKHRVDTQAVREAIRSRGGQRITEDYRGVRVFSTFERLDLFNTTWIIIAEIDESEVITDAYRSAPATLADRLAASGRTGGSPGEPPPRGDGKRVDMNEYAKTDGRVLLRSYGVAACTAVAVIMPNRFAYLAHISPRDAIYRRPFWKSVFSRDASPDFLGELIRRIRHYDVYPFELRQLRFFIIAPHTFGFDGAVAKILEAGVDLGNIVFMYDPSAEGANIAVDAVEGTVHVQWYTAGRQRWTSSRTATGLARLYKEAIGYES